MSPHQDGTWRATRRAALRPPVAIAALLLFVWPLVRVPPLSLADAWGHLFGAWAVLIVALFVMARAPEDGGASRGGGSREHGA